MLSLKGETGSRGNAVPSPQAPPCVILRPPTRPPAGRRLTARPTPRGISRGPRPHIAGRGIATAYIALPQDNISHAARRRIPRVILRPAIRQAVRISKTATKPFWRYVRTQLVRGERNICAGKSQACSNRASRFVALVEIPTPAFVRGLWMTRTRYVRTQLFPVQCYFFSPHRLASAVSRFSFDERGAKEKLPKENTEKDFALYGARPKAPPWETVTF